MFILILLVLSGVPKLNPNPVMPLGVVTVGTGAGESIGNVNAADKNGDIGAALSEALKLSKFVMILPGNYTQTTLVTLATDGQHIMGVGNPQISTSLTTSPRSIAITGNRVKVQGIHFTSSTFVNDSVFITSTGDETDIDDNRFTCTASTGSNANPMFYFKAGTTSQGVKSPRMTRNRVHFAKGVGGFHIAGDPDAGSTSGTGAMVSINHFGTESGTPEKGYVAIRFESAGEAVVTGNRIHGIGDGTDKAFAAIYATTTNSQSEAHHLNITGNNTELVTSQHILRADGCRFLTFNSNTIGRCLGNGSGEGTIHITDNTGTGTDGAAINIIGNDIHNASTSDGRAIIVEDVDTVTIKHNTFSLCNGRQIQVATSAVNVLIGPNVYRMSPAVTGSLIQVSGAYTGLVIDEPSIPSGCTMLAAQPTGAIVNGLNLGGQAPLAGQPQLVRTRAAGAANGANITVGGITTSDTLARVINVTDKAVETLSNFTVGAGIVTQTTGDTSGDTLILEWYDA